MGTTVTISRAMGGNCRGQSDVRPGTHFCFLMIRIVGDERRGAYRDLFWQHVDAETADDIRLAPLLGMPVPTHDSPRQSAGAWEVGGIQEDVGGRRVRKREFLPRRSSNGNLDSEGAMMERGWMKIEISLTPSARRRATAIACLAGLLTGCTVNLAGSAGYGNYGGPARDEAVETISLEQTTEGVRWFPRHVRFAPDESKLLVSLCHTKRRDFCRIGRFDLATERWEVLPFDAKSTYTWPLYAPSGDAIYVLTAPCDDQLRCNFAEQKLLRLGTDGKRTEEVAQITATHLNISPDGKRLIYWRIGSFYSVQGRMQNRANIFEMNLETRQERPLLKEEELYAYQEDRSFSFFLSDGESFYFNASFRDSRNNRDEAKSGWSIGRLKDVPVGPKDITRIGGRNWNTQWLDMTHDDKLAANGDITQGKRDGDPVAWSIRNPQAGPGQHEDWSKLPAYKVESRRMGGGTALVLAPALPNARYVAAFDFYGCMAAAITPTGNLAACIEDNKTFSRYRRGLELSRLGEQGSRRIEWPHLTLTPGFIDLNNQD